METGCNKCEWKGLESELKLMKEDREYHKACPNCLTDAYLTDLPVTLHDITANGKTFILEWTHTVEGGDGHIAITETCSDPFDEEEHDHETHDFKEYE